jgi:hypothetical protein
MVKESSLEATGRYPTIGESSMELPFLNLTRRKFRIVSPRPNKKLFTRQGTISPVWRQHSGRTGSRCRNLFVAFISAHVEEGVSFVIREFQIELVSVLLQALLEDDPNIAQKYAEDALSLIHETLTRPSLKNVESSCRRIRQRSPTFFRSKAKRGSLRSGSTSGSSPR